MQTKKKKKKKPTMKESSILSVARLGRSASVLAGLFTCTFALALAFDFNSQTGIDFVVCFFLPLAYLFMTLANSHLVKARSGDVVSSFYADAAHSIATIYAVYIFACYYIQLTFVRQARADPIALTVVEYKPGSALFAIDILGYVLLSLSTLFLASSLKGTDEHVLIGALRFHGLFGVTSIAVPFLPMIYEERPNKEAADDNFIWQLPLISWCGIFMPTCILMARYFASNAQKKEMS
jgi:hypothetical protein